MKEKKIKTIRVIKMDAQSVLRILQNEKYAGMHYFKQPLIINTQKELLMIIMTQYYVENSHHRIITETFEMVQKRIATFTLIDQPRVLTTNTH